MTIGTARTKIRRALFAALGVVFTALGVIGVFVPGLPTTVFVIAASYLFARSSPALERWIRRHRWVGPPLKRFEETGGMTLRSKAFAIAWMWLGVTFSWYALGGISPGVRVLIVALGLLGTGTLLVAVRTIRVSPAGSGGRPFSAPGGMAWRDSRLDRSRHRLLVEPGFLVCFASPVSARETGSACWRCS